MFAQQETNISIIIPCRNEEEFISACLDSIIMNDYPKERLEVLVIDGMSLDGTRKIVERYAREHSFIRLLSNPKQVIPAAMNIGIQQAQGDVIMKMDAHSAYANGYISKCVQYLNEYNADNVGGMWKIVPRENTRMGRSICLALSSPFGAGNAYFRIGSREPRWVDTAPFGCYRKDVFQRIGLYDEDIARSEDVDINSRLRRAGGRILLAPDIVINYYARSDYASFTRHNFDNGFWVTYPLKFGTVLFSWRHLVPLVFVISLICLVALSFFSSAFSRILLAIASSYIIANLYFSDKIAQKEKGAGYLLFLPVVFASLHIMYGLGSIWGLVKAVASKCFWSKLYQGREHDEKA